MKIIKLLIFTVLLCWDFQSISQIAPPFFKHITNIEGLSSNRANCIFEDSEGLMWIGTNDGLNLYNGSSITTFKHDPKNPTTISNDYIYCVVEDKITNKIWIGTDKGVNVFDKNTYQFSGITINESSNITVNNMCARALQFDSQNQLWIAGLKIFCLNAQKDSIKEYIVTNKRTNMLVGSFSLFIDKTDRLLLGTDQGACIFNQATDKFEPINENFRRVNNFYQDSKNNLWVCTYANGLFCYLDGNFEATAKRYTTSNGFLINNRSHDMVEDKLGNYYIINRDGGLVYFDKKKDTTYHFYPDKHSHSSLNSKALTNIHKDTKGNIWIGTYSHGINFIDQHRKPLEHYQMNFREDGLFNNNIRSMFQDVSGNIWIGTKEDGGLSKFNRKAGTFTHFRPDKNDPHSINHDYIFAINEIDSSYLLVGTFLNGLDILDKETGKFTHNITHHADTNSISHNRILSIYKDKKGIIWIGTHMMLNTYDPKNQKFSHLADVRAINCFCEEDDDNIWLGGTYKLFLYNTKTRKTTNFPHDDKDATSISNNFITALQKDSKGNLWIGTNAGGINFLAKNSRKFVTYNVSDGLANNSIYGLLIDDHDNIWVSTANGVSKFNPATKTFRNFDIYDGLQDNEFTIGAALKTKNGEMLFGGKNGFNIFHPDSITDNPLIPSVIITGFKIFNKSVEIGGANAPLTKHISKTKELTLNHKQSKITFEFAALNYSTPNKNQYAYMIEGFDNEWNYIGYNREASYTNLPAGEYVFKVKASNNDGIWNNKGASIKLIILPPWWETLWFRALFVITIVGSGVFYYSIRMRKMKEEKLILEKKVAERTSELQLANCDLEEKQEEIYQQNEELQSKNTILAEQKKEVNKMLEEIEIKNIVLEERNSQIIEAHNIVEDQNKSIKSSISYAKTIQQAILPTKIRMDSLMDNFVIYRPKDIVSGDFYWMTTVTSDNAADNCIFVAAVDCTGHGVPGAFMSMIGSRLLSSIVNERKVYDPSEILNQLNAGVIKALSQNVSENDDGMDICLCKIEKGQSTKVTFSGAKRPLYYYKSKTDEICKIKGSLNTIGGVNYLKEFPYTNVELTPSKGDVIYLTSDGFVDQSDHNRKSFGSSTFVKLLATYAKSPVELQQQKLETALDKFMNGVKQRDDITVIGIKL